MEHRKAGMYRKEIRATRAMGLRQILMKGLIPFDTPSSTSVLEQLIMFTTEDRVYNSGFLQLVDKLTFRARKPLYDVTHALKQLHGNHTYTPK